MLREQKKATRKGVVMGKKTTTPVIHMKTYSHPVLSCPKLQPELPTLHPVIISSHASITFPTCADICVPSTIHCLQSRTLELLSPLGGVSISE